MIIFMTLEEDNKVLITSNNKYIHYDLENYISKMA